MLENALIEDNCGINVIEADKVDVARVKLHRIDGVTGTANVTSMTVANMVLQGWRKTMPEGKQVCCEVELTFEDGHRYEVTYPSNSDQKVPKYQSLSTHLHKHLEKLASGASSGVAKDAKEMLESYAF